jgi:hypothetical protein
MKSVIETYKDKDIVKNFDKERDEFEYQRFLGLILTIKHYSELEK